MFYSIDTPMEDLFAAAALGTVNSARLSNHIILNGKPGGTVNGEYAMNMVYHLDGDRYYIGFDGFGYAYVRQGEHPGQCRRVGEFGRYLVSGNAVWEAFEGGSSQPVYVGSSHIGAVTWAEMNGAGPRWEALTAPPVGWEDLTNRPA